MDGMVEKKFLSPAKMEKYLKKYGGEGSHVQPILGETPHAQRAGPSWCRNPTRAHPFADRLHLEDVDAKSESE
jgi:hypothetical protein